MKKTILYAITAAVVAAAAAITVGGCGGDFGERSETMDGFLDKFHYNKPKVKKVSLIYDMNGADCEAPKTDEPLYDSGTTVYLKQPCSRTNGELNFLRWNSARDGSGEYSGDPERFPFPIIEDITLYAVWTSDRKYEVSIISSIAGMYIPNSGTYRVDENVIIDAGTPPEGWKFQEWTTESRGVSFDDANSASTSFRMPGNNVTVKAKFIATGGALGWFTDNRNNIAYKMVTIGGQTWMAQNLDYEIDNSWCYDNDPYNCNIYGRLYNWDAAIKVCPSGWHLPDTAEWRRLVNAAGGQSTAGKALKSTNGWDLVNNGNGTDEYGWSALPGGLRESGDSFHSAVYYGGWWTATTNEYSGGYAYSRYMSFNNDNVNEDDDDKSSGRSVRCLKND